MSDKTAVILFGDQHQNHIFGLCPPNFNVSERGTWELNPPQQELWYAWSDCLDWMNKVTSGYRRVGISVGDAIENDSKIRNQSELISLKPSDALSLANTTLDPLVQTLDHFFVVKGTAAHVGEAAWTEDKLAEDLGAVPDEEMNSPAWRHLVAEFSGVKFDVAHHPAGNSNITRNYFSVASRLAYDVMEAYMMKWEEEPPHYAIRGHLHRFADSGIGMRTRGVILPGFQYKTYYLSRIGKDGDMPDVGMVVVLCDNGQSELLEHRVRPQNRRKVWSVQKSQKRSWKDLLKIKS